MILRRPRSWIQWLRRLCQAACLSLFLWLVLSARFGGDETSPPLLQVFFDLDPLVFLATLLSAHTFTSGALLALLTIVATVLLGRVFCGWVCPLGTIHHIASWFRKPRKGRAALESRSPWQRTKYILLIALLVMALFGVHWIGVFDPIPLLYRSVTAGVLPAAQYAIEDTSTAAYRSDPHIGSLHLTSVTEPVYRFSRDNVFRVGRQTFLGSVLIAAFFITIVALNFVRPRFWCRYVCPLGGLLGLLSWRPMLRLKNDESACKSCGKCNLACPAAAQPDQPGAWLPTECFVCWNCVPVCDVNSIGFTFESPLRKPKAGKLDLGRRATLAAGAGGIAALLAFRLPPQVQGKQPFPATLIRPPGARPEREFLQRCIQCGLCMRVCPTNGLQPVGLEAGIEAVWTPKLVPKIGYCQDNCNLCGQVCPTEAIRPLPLEEKRKFKLGLATVDTTRCLPYAYGRECIVCEEHCPLSPKAIYVVEAEVHLRDGGTRVLQQPKVDPDLCVGCGICEWACVFQDRAAIRVTSANETRHPENQPILPNFGSGYG